ncbi:hypothetical protein [Oceanobacillus halophilus]|uniref:Uncharacterized protein n=1 Tax=Oceanobacillus halophilus TaxID=930130 RepID=A0A495A379_9BACI|nr:hypothetical protein [Oceanobacillus halophilus]RKQ33973.1 hypothetical protein D8M06_09125 [Oceanobacillus halophilus]
MEFCPLCNGVETLIVECPNCQTAMEDQGKVTDFFDDYSAYMDIDMMKMYDGDANSLENHECLHYFYCYTCHHEETKAMKD